jgi:hypothetical protein
LPVVVVTLLLVLQPLGLTVCMLKGLFTTWQFARPNRTLLRFTDIAVLTPDLLESFHETLPVVVVVTVYRF